MNFETSKIFLFCHVERSETSLEKRSLDKLGMTIVDTASISNF